MLAFVISSYILRCKQLPAEVLVSSSRRRLTVCPILDSEEQLRLLNYQHNMIQHIEHLNGLKRLIFLDLYDNQIMEISGLSGLRSLRVLMLGKNK